VYVAAAMAGPGHVRHHGRGELVIGDAADSGRWVALFAEAGVPVQVSSNVAGMLWAKLIVNCACNAVSAIAQQPYGVLAGRADVLAVMRDAVDECLTVAQALGVAVPGDAWAMVQGILETMPSQLSSTAQDLARGRRTEIAHLNGYVVREGAALGVPTPVNRTLLALVSVLEASAVGAGWPASAARADGVGWAKLG
jgi:2-dehydropantoate 2-reductase